MKISVLNQQTTPTKTWENLRQQIAAFDWGGAKLTAKKMTKAMEPNERVIVAIDKNKVIGTGSLTEKDIADLPVTPFISAIYVKPAYRQSHVGTEIVKAALSTAQQIGFHDVYVISGLKNYYEKMGFELQDHVTDFMRRRMKLYHRKL